MREVIVQAMKDTGMSVNAIATAMGEGGVSQAALSRFVNGERDMLLDTAEKLVKHLGLKLVKEDPAG